MSDKILYKGETYGNTLGTNAALILTETPTRTEDGVDFYIKEVEGETKEVAIENGSRATYGNLSGHTLVVQGLKMTFCDNIYNAFQNGWVSPTDLYTSFDVDVGLRTVSSRTIKLPALKHYEIVPYTRTSNITKFCIRNTKTKLSARPNALTGTSPGLNIAYIADAEQAFSGPGSSTYPFSPTGSDYSIAWLAGQDNSSDYTTLRVVSDYELTHSYIADALYSSVANVSLWKYAGVYFLASEILKTGALYIYDEKNSQWSNDKYIYGCVLACPYFVTLGEIAKSEIAESYDSFNPNLHKGYLSSSNLIMSNGSTADNTSYKVKGDNYFYWKYQQLTSTGTGSSDPLYVTIPFANEAERDFALGMTENLQYLTKEEYERLP